MEMDMAQFKLEFAELMTKLEQAPEKAVESVHEEASMAEVVIVTAVVLVGKHFFKRR